jgi:hypothetical protein
MRRYLLHVLIALDQVFTTLLGGWPDETLSSYAWRLEVQDKPWGRFWRPLIDALFFWEPPGHCERSYFSERARLQMPPPLRD